MWDTQARGRENMCTSELHPASPHKVSEATSSFELPLSVFLWGGGQGSWLTCPLHMVPSSRHSPEESQGEHSQGLAHPELPPTLPFLRRLKWLLPPLLFRGILGKCA